MSGAIFSAGLLMSHLVAADARFVSEDIFELEYASDVQISADGSHIVYVRSSHDVMSDGNRHSLWMHELSSDKHYPLHADQYNYTKPVWSANGKKLAFVSNRDGRNQLYVHWLEQDKNAVITQVEKGISDIRWSPDGNWLAFTMEVPAGPSEYAKSVYTPKKPKGAKWAESTKIIEKARYQADGKGILEPAYRHVFVVPTTGGSARQLTEGDYQHRGPLAWVPDSSALVFSANRNKDWEYQGSEANLYQISLHSAEMTELTDAPGTEYNPQFSPDGKQLAYLTRTDARVPYQNTEVALMNTSNRKTRQISEKLDRSVSDYGWQNSNNIVIQYDDRGKRKLAKMNLDGKLQVLTDNLSGATLGRPYISGSFSVADNGAIAYTHGSSQRPADLGYWFKGKARQLTDLNQDLLGHKQLGQVHEIEYASSFDGEKIQGWYITPPDFDPEKTYPLLLEIHGGPHLAYGPHFSAELQRYAAEGYVVFYANHRGSSSYGERFAMLLDGKYSSREDFADHNSGVDAMIAKGFIDDRNLFIAGGSAGGIASAYAIGLTDRFNAAAITKPVINWVSKVLTADSYLGQIRNQFPGMPWDNLEHYWQRSPLSLVGNVTTPSLIMTGEADRRTPMSESEQFYQALKLRKVDAALVRVPGAPHGIAGKPSRMIAKIEHTLAWFKRYRKD
ncbi:acyl-peptide hydrolase [Lacimicrobium alkaliphilum]|uniref:Acyl-peptide hydrolase n=2 Tax=Lacimicrobium alkaliphilum TaxID=1526571 RepID=A0A0U2Z854_9ALTE|nr:acyl-peptide hydrolase [Lacimicrobium alkaliphilum]